MAGRLIRNRGAFLLIQDDSDQVQLYVDRKALDAETLEEIKGWDLGDIVAASGPIHKSGKGDLYINMRQARLLTCKALRPCLTSTTAWLTRNCAIASAMSISSSTRIPGSVSHPLENHRLYPRLHERGGVYGSRNPMMQVIPGGAAARPFVTHHNAPTRTCTCASHRSCT